MSEFIGLETFKSLYNSCPVYIFDTNVFLDLLRYSKNSSKDLLSIYNYLQEDIRVLPQVNLEFNKNLPIVEGNRISQAKKSITEIKKSINNCNEAIMKQLNFFVKYKFDACQNIKVRIEKNLNDLKKEIENYSNTHVISKNNGFLDVNEVTEFFTAINNDSYIEELTYNELFNIYKEGDIRFKYKIPPGYMDDPNNNSDSAKEGTAIFGDLVLWNELIAYGKKCNRPCIFITSDVKEDWFILKSEKPIAPRDELQKEYYEKTGGKQLCILTSERFVEYLGKILPVDNIHVLAEMQKDVFAENVIQNNQDELSQKMIEWLNSQEHIYLLPFLSDINTVTSIEDLNIVIQDVAVDIKEKAYYTVNAQATAEFIGAFYDKRIERYTLSDERDTFIFTMNISFERAFEKNNSIENLFSSDVTNINATCGEFERCNPEGVSLESMRGVFIKPNDLDYEIHSYLMNQLEKYEDSNSSDRAEALVYIEAANHFDCSLLEVNRSFLLVQNQTTKSSLSLNEIDALSIKRLKDIGFLIIGNTCTYERKSVKLGEPYPTPETMKILPPEKERELPVDFTIKIDRPLEKYVQIIGTTTLPKDTQLMISLTNRDLNYSASSKTNVQMDHSFKSDVFKNGSNSDQNILISGKYNLEIVVPIVSVQPDSVKIIFGKNGRNLTGQYVTYDAIMGNTINYSKLFDIC